MLHTSVSNVAKNKIWKKLGMLFEKNMVVRNITVKFLTFVYRLIAHGSLENILRRSVLTGYVVDYEVM